MTTTVTILGATGSVGASTLDLVARHPERFEVFALTAHRSESLLLERCLQYRPVVAVLSGLSEDSGARERFRAAGCQSEVLFGPEALVHVARAEPVAFVLAAIVGAAGLPASLAAARAGKRVLLANKEALVMAGSLFMDAVRDGGATLLPIDSEHNAVLQCMPHDERGRPRTKRVRRILLTASGGPFLTTAVERFAQITPDEACAHPNWRMGRKISVDSATMMNKGLEVIEASWLFDIPPERIEVVIHPQSVIHSLVEFVDGSMIAQLSNPDMRVPIAHALAFPERMESGARALKLAEYGSLSFAEPDLVRFPCLGLAYEALRRGGSAPAVLNAANEIAVAAFLDCRIAFNAIAGIIEDVLSACAGGDCGSIDELLAIDRHARATAERRVSHIEARVA